MNKDITISIPYFFVPGLNVFEIKILQILW